jgi:hypothetical protein
MFRPNQLFLPVWFDPPIAASLLSSHSSGLYPQIGRIVPADTAAMDSLSATN